MFSTTERNMWSENLKKLTIVSCLIFWTTGASQPQNRVKATIGKPISLACPLNIRRLIHLSWNRCSAEDQCRKDWDKSRITYITDMKNIYVDYPERYELAANGTLTIKEVKPEDDNKILICRGMTRFGKEENITVLEIIRESPRIDTRNPREYEIIEGMPLIIEFKVYGYPYPLVSVTHNEDIVLKGTKVGPVYMRENASESYNGNYTFTAENSLGNASFTIKVKVVARTATNSSCQGNRTAGVQNTEQDINSEDGTGPTPPTISGITTTGNPGNSGTNWKEVAVVFIVLFCVLVLGVIVVGYILFVAYCKHHQAIHQVGNAHDRGGNCLENGSTIVRYLESPDDRSTCIVIDKSDGSKGNSVENGFS